MGVVDFFHLYKCQHWWRHIERHWADWWTSIQVSALMAPHWEALSWLMDIFTSASVSTDGATLRGTELLDGHLYKCQHWWRHIERHWAAWWTSIKVSALMAPHWEALSCLIDIYTSVGTDGASLRGTELLDGHLYKCQHWWRLLECHWAAWWTSIQVSALMAPHWVTLSRVMDIFTSVGTDCASLSETELFDRHLYKCQHWWRYIEWHWAAWWTSIQLSALMAHHWVTPNCLINIYTSVSTDGATLRGTELLDGHLYECQHCWRLLECHWAAWWTSIQVSALMAHHWVTPNCLMDIYTIVSTDDATLSDTEPPDGHLYNCQHWWRTIEWHRTAW